MFTGDTLTHCTLTRTSLAVLSTVSGLYKWMYRNSTTLNLSVLGVKGVCVCVWAHVCACMRALSRVQLFCDPRDYSLPAFSVRVIFQARGLEWVAIFSSMLRGWNRLNQGWHQPSFHEFRETQGPPLLSSWAGVRPGQTRSRTHGLYALGRNNEGGSLPPVTFIQSPPCFWHSSLPRTTRTPAGSGRGDSWGYLWPDRPEPRGMRLWRELQPPVLPSPPQAGGSGRRSGAKAAESPRHGFPALTSPCGREPPRIPSPAWLSSIISSGGSWLTLPEVVFLDKARHFILVCSSISGHPGPPWNPPGDEAERASELETAFSGRRGRNPTSSGRFDFSLHNLPSSLSLSVSPLHSVWSKFSPFQRPHPPTPARGDFLTWDLKRMTSWGPFKIPSMWLDQGPKPLLSDFIMTSLRNNLGPSSHIAWRRLHEPGNWTGQEFPRLTVAQQWEETSLGWGTSVTLRVSTGRAEPSGATDRPRDGWQRREIKEEDKGKKKSWAAKKRGEETEGAKKQDGERRCSHGPWGTLAPVQNVLGVTRIGRSCLHGNTRSPARKPLSTHHLSLRFRPWIRKPRPGDCQMERTPWSIWGCQWWTGFLLGGGNGPELCRTFTLWAPRHSWAAASLWTLPFRCTSNPSPPGGALAPVENLSEPEAHCPQGAGFKFTEGLFHLHSKLYLFTNHRKQPDCSVWKVL